MRPGMAIIIAAALFSCKSAPVKQSDVSAKTGNDTTNFFQVSNYIRSQIDEVSKTPYYIYQSTISGNRQDSVAIDNVQFGELAKKFLQPDINDPSLKKHYRESVFYDETTQSFSLSYATTNKDLEIQNIDVLLYEDGKKVKRIFIRKFYTYPDSTAIEQLSWKPNQSFQIVRLLQATGKPETSRQVRVVWNDKG